MLGAMGAAESEPVAGPHERNVHAVDGTVLPSKLFTVEDASQGYTDVNHIMTSWNHHRIIRRLVRNEAYSIHILGGGVGARINISILVCCRAG